MGLNSLPYNTRDGTLDWILLTAASGSAILGTANMAMAIQDLQAGTPGLDIFAREGVSALGLFLVAGALTAKAVHGLYNRWQNYRAEVAGRVAWTGADGIKPYIEKIL